MSNELSVNYYSLPELREKEELGYSGGKIFERLSKNHLKSIENAFLQNTKISSNGIIYIRIKGLANILRTSSRGVASTLIYNGVEGVLSSAALISIEGEEYISGPSLIGFLDYRIKTVPVKQQLYLTYSKNIYDYINGIKEIANLAAIYTQEIDDNRKFLKRKKISEYNISCCEFTGKKFSSISEVDFAHIESVVTSPHLALNLDNGVIIFKDIHSELTRLEIVTFEGMYEYCCEKDYKLDWADSFIE